MKYKMLSLMLKFLLRLFTWHCGRSTRATVKACQNFVGPYVFWMDGVTQYYLLPPLQIFGTAHPVHQIEWFAPMWTNKPSTLVFFIRLHRVYAESLFSNQASWTEWKKRQWS